MFFKKRSANRPPAAETASPKLTAIPGGATGRPTPSRAAMRTVEGGGGEEVALVLDALGSLLTTYARHTFDLANESGEDAQRRLLHWQRHATLGMPLDAEEGNAVGVRDRAWDDVARVFAEHRRQESRYVATTIPELRDALWAVVESVHKAVDVDRATDRVAGSQVERARQAISRLQAGSIKQEVLGAMTALEEAMRAKQEAQRAEYATLAAHIERLGSQLEEAKKESTTDALTGLGNRKLFDMMAERALHLHSLSGQPTTLLMIDLDKLKLINDMYGHQAGDAAIAGIGNCLAKVFMRQSDVLCRYGGDEFAAILTNTDWKTAKTLAGRLQEHVGTMPSPHPSMEFAAAASVGIAEYGGEGLEGWVARADKALYDAKQRAGERIVVADRTRTDQAA